MAATYLGATAGRSTGARQWFGIGYRTGSAASAGRALADHPVHHIIEGAAQALWGAQVHGLELGISDETLEVGGLLLLQFDLFAATTAAALVLLLSLLFNRPRMGLSLCAVADDPRAALTIGAFACQGCGRWSGRSPASSVWSPG